MKIWCSKNREWSVLYVTNMIRLETKNTLKHLEYIYFTGWSKRIIIKYSCRFDINIYINSKVKYVDTLIIEWKITIIYVTKNEWIWQKNIEYNNIFIIFELLKFVKFSWEVNYKTWYKWTMKRLWNVNCNMYFIFNLYLWLVPWKIIQKVPFNSKILK